MQLISHDPDVGLTDFLLSVTRPKCEPALSVTGSIQNEKLVLRHKVGERVRGISAEIRRASSALARERLASQERWNRAETILGYAPIAGELDVWPLLLEALREGKRVFLPRFVAGKPLKRFPQQRSGSTLLKQGVNERGPGGAGPKQVGSDGVYVACEIKSPEKDVLSGRFGIREPGESCAEIELNRLDFTLVPGVAFDLQGRRLGRGKGFYDRMLAAVRGTTCGVAFDEQIVGEVPVEPHDTRVNCILTPTRWFEL
jgi:5-formyltetrahydrofolate cyclo-ligase